MKQTSMFPNEFPPATRSSDPITSREGEAAVDRNVGVAEIMDVLENSPGISYTSMEMADVMINARGYPWWKVDGISKRCSDAVAKGLAVKLPKRRCYITGRMAHPIRKSQP